MELQHSPYIPPLLIAGLITLASAIYTFRQRRMSGAVNLMALLLSITLWILAYAVELAVINEPAKLFWAKVQWLGISYIPVGYILFILDYNGSLQAIKKPRLFIYLLVTIPAFTLLLVWTSTWHQLIWRAWEILVYRGSAYMRMTYGLGYWIFVGYTYLLLIIGAFLLLSKIFSASAQFKGQIILVLAGSLVPWLGNIIHITRVNPLPHLDPTPFTFAISILCLAWAFFQFNFLNVVPIARGLVVESLDSGVLVLDRKNRVIDINATAVYLLKKEKKALLGKTLAFDQPQWTPLAAALQENASTTVELLLDQAYYEGSVTTLDKRHGVANGRLIILRNITKRKETELLLQQAKDAAKAAEQAKAHFLTNMSHEIRTPLNAVVGMTEMLRQTPLNANQNEMINVVARSSNHLILLINNILDFAKLEAGNLMLNQQTFDLIDCFESAIDSVSQAANKKKLQLTYQLAEETPAWLVGDPVRLRQILISLLENSIKFTEEGKIELFVTHSQEADKIVLQVTVQDSGIGIEPDQIQYLFTPFQQIDGSMTRAHGGNGLGLVICQRLVKMMDGDICIQSEPGRGTVVHFTVRLDVATNAHPPAVKLRKPKATLALKRLLIISKDAGERRSISKEARTAGLEVYTAGTIREAAYWINHSQPFDAAVLDAAIWQEEPSVVSRLHHKKSASAMPIILLVPSESEQPLIADSDAGLFAGTLTTPVNFSQLYDVLLNTLATGEAKGAYHEQSQTMAERHPFTILIVEDNDVNRRVLKNMLNNIGYEADEAPNGHLAVEAARHKKYDIILMDVQMPVMDGIEATRHILTNSSSGERPYIITVTAHALEGDREYYLSIGMNEYISKPVTMNRLVEVLYQAVHYHTQTVPASSEPAGALAAPEASVTATPDNTHLNPIDFVELAKLVGDNVDDFLHMMAPIFMEDTQRILQKLTNAVHGQNSQEVRQAAHTLKGSSASMAMTTLSHLCRELETMAKEDKLTDAEQTLAKIQTEYALVETSLVNIVKAAV